MASSTFDACLAVVLHWEGGYSNHPDDPGGPTMQGIVQREYNAFRKASGKSCRPVRQIEDAELREIYRKSYWDVMGCDALAPGMDLCVFDAAVNSGTGRAKRWLAEKPGDIDGFCDARLAFLQRLGRLWRVFGAGWKRRVAGIRADAHGMAGNASSEPLPRLTELHAGMGGRAVLALQRRLRELGYPCGLVDGIYGEQTYRAVILFQADHDLSGNPGVWLPEYDAVAAQAPAMLPGRKCATPKDVAATGDKPIAHMNLLQRIFAWVFGASAAAQVLDSSDVATSLTAAKGVFDPLLSVWAWAGDHRFLLAAIGCIGAIALVRAIRADHVEAFRNFDYQGQAPRGEKESLA